MKNLKNLSFIILLAAFFTSCVKDHDVLEDAAKGASNSVGFAGGLSSPVTLDVVPDTPFLVIPVTAFYSGSGGAGGNVEISIVTDPAVVNAYDSSYGDVLEPMPQGAIVSTPSSITIPGGSNQGSASIVINLDSMLAYGTYFGVGVKITNSNGAAVSPGRSEQVYIVSVRNVFDGHYSVSGTLTDTYLPSITGNYPMDVYLITQTGNSVAMYDLEIGGYFHSILSGGSLGYYGGFCPVITIDASGNVTEVHNYYAVNDPSNTNMRTARLDPSGVNKYDAATKTLQVSYIMYQGTLGIDRTFFDETFSYVGPR